MASRTESMRLYNSDQASEKWHLLRKVILLSLLVVALALGLAIVFRQTSRFPLLLFNILADISLGLLMGLGTRFVLKKRNWFLKYLTSASISIIGLAVLGYFTGWKSGIGPFHVGFVKENWLSWAHIPLLLPLQFTRTSMDLLDLAHMMVAVDTSWLALRAWSKLPRVGNTNLLSAQPLGSRSSILPNLSVLQPNITATKIRLPTKSSFRAKVKRKKGVRPLISRPAASAFETSKSIRSKRRNFGHHKPIVQLAVHEDHRCPYCLEEVNRSDSRGVVECQVCHTLHHKDCWDITGSCQVPHLNT